MDGSIALTLSQRNGLLRRLHTEPDPQNPPAAPHPAAAGRRASLEPDHRHPVLLQRHRRPLAKALPRWRHESAGSGRAGPAAEPVDPAGPPSWSAGSSGRCPATSRFYRSRWCCRTLVVLLLSTYRVTVSGETVRRWLHAHRNGLATAASGAPTPGSVPVSRTPQHPRAAGQSARRSCGGVPGRGGSEPQSPRSAPCGCQKASRRR